MSRTPLWVSDSRSLALPICSRYVFCRELPKNSYGKVLKTELRELLAEAEAPNSPSDAPYPDPLAVFPPT